MKINQNNQLGLNFTQHIKDNFYKIHNENFFSKYPDDFVESFRNQFKDILNDEGNKNLLFTNTSKQVAEKIKVDKFEPKILKTDKHKKLTFLIDDTHFYRVHIKGDELFCMLVLKEKRESDFYISYHSFKIKPIENEVVFPKNQNDYKNDKYFLEFIKLLIFTEYSELEEVTLMPNQSKGNKKEGKIYNDSNKSFIIVDSTWNKIIIRTDKFGVSGHLRLQPIGKNRNDRKLIYISEYLKNGYTKRRLHYEK
jgi:hypothetical protein